MEVRRSLTWNPPSPCARTCDTVLGFGRLSLQARNNCYSDVSANPDDSKLIPTAAGCLSLCQCDPKMPKHTSKSCCEQTHTPLGRPSVAESVSARTFLGEYPTSDTYVDL